MITINQDQIKELEAFINTIPTAYGLRECATHSFSYSEFDCYYFWTFSCKILHQSD